jgi:hypothetical protein
MVPVCEQHHHLVHEGRWTLSMTPDRVATWTRPDGTIHHHGTTIDRTPPAATTNRTDQQPGNGADRRSGPGSGGPTVAGERSRRRAPVPTRAAGRQRQLAFDGTG